MARSTHTYQRRTSEHDCTNGDTNAAAIPVPIHLHQKRRTAGGLRVTLVGRSTLATLLPLLAILCSLTLTFTTAQPADGPLQPVLLNSDELRWVSLSPNSTAAGAVCNDRSVPGFWASLATPSSVGSGASIADVAASGSTVSWSRRWVIYLESGGACVDAYSCQLRAYDTPDHVTSYNSSRTKQAANLLSASQTLNPTAYDHHHVFAHYCSSDFWLGRQPGAAASATVSPYAFQGAAIFRGLVRDLIAADTDLWKGSTNSLRAPSLADATEIILVGSSAGGVGAINHANWLRDAVQAEQQSRWALLNSTTSSPPPLQLVQVRLLIDSSWFVDYQNQVGTLSRMADVAWNMNGAVAVGQPEAMSCAAPMFNVLEVGSGADPAVAGVMCCFLASCVASTFLSTSIHLLVVQSLYDSFLLALGNSGLLGTLLPDLLPSGEQGVSATSISPQAIERAVALVQLVSSYGGAYNTSMQLQRRSALVAAGMQGTGIYNLHFALLSCFNHMYLPHEVRDQVDGHEPFYNRVHDESWTKVIVPRRGANGVSNATDDRNLRDIIAHWHANTAEAVTTANPLTHPLHYTDYCSQAQCNPTCPDFVRFSPSSLSDQISSSRLFHTDDMWHFVLKIVCLIWLFFPAVLQIMVWVWSSCTRGRSRAEMQLLALASPLSPVQRRRKRGPNTLQRYPSIMSTNAISITQKGQPVPEEDEELAAEMARKAMVHFSFLALYYWPAPIIGPAKTVAPHGSKANLLRVSPLASKHPAAQHNQAAPQSQSQQPPPRGTQVAPQPVRPATPTDVGSPPPASAFTIVQSSPSYGPRQPSSVTQRFDESVRGVGGPRANGKVGDATSTNNSSGSSLRKTDEDEALKQPGGGHPNPPDSTVIDMESSFRTALEAVVAEEAEEKRKAAAAAAAAAAPAATPPHGSPRRGGYVRRVANSVEMTGVMPTASPSPPPAGLQPAAPPASSAAAASLPIVAPFVVVEAVPNGSAQIASAVPSPIVVSEKPPLPRLKSSLKEKPQQSPSAGADTSGDEAPPQLNRARTKRLGAPSVSFRTAEMMVKTAAEQAVDREHDMAEMRAASGLPLEAFTKLTQPLLKGVNGRFSSGQMIALMGKSGCGKSTLLELLACRRTFGMTHGTMFINGQPLQECMGWMKSAVGFVSQYGSSAVPTLSVLDNLLYAAKLRLPLGWSRSKKLARVQAVIDMCGLGPMKHTLVGSNEGDKGGLSGGQRRRVALAIELLAAPRLLMLDEITSGLDASSALEILLVLHSIVESTNMCCVLSIHQPRVESWGLFHQVLVLDAGHVIFQGAPFAALHEFTQGIIEASAWGLAKRDSDKLLKISSAAFENKQPGQDSSQNVNVADFLLDCLKYPAIGRSMQQRYERVYRNEIVDLIEHGIQEAVKIDLKSRPGTPVPAEGLASMKAPPTAADRRKKTLGEIPVLARNRSIGEMPPGWQAAVLRGRTAGEAAPAAASPPTFHRQRSMVDAPTLGRQRSMVAGGESFPAGMQRQKSTGEAPPMYRQRSVGDAPPGIMRTRTMAHRPTASTTAAAKPVLLRAVAPKVSFLDSLVQTLLNIATLESRRLHALSSTPIELVKMPCFFLFLGTVLPAFFFLRISSALDTATWFVLLTNISNHMACTPLTFTFFDSMPLYNKERLSGAVTPLQHLVALSLHVSTFAILASNLGWVGGFLISTPATWSMISWSNMLDQILLECMCMRCFTFLYSLLVSVGYPKISLETTTMLAAFTVSFFFVFSGFLVAPRLIPPYLLWVLYINPMYWAFGAIVKVRIVELISLSDAAAAARSVTSSTGSSCAEGVSGWQCLLFQIPSFDTHGDSPMTTKLVLTTYDLADIDVYSSLFILLLMSVFFAVMSWLFLAAPWRVLAPTECALHEEQIALAAAYREEEVVKEFEAKQMQVKMREVEFKRVQQAAVEDVSILHSQKSKAGVSGDLTNAFAPRGAARWAAIIRQRLYGGGSTMLLEMEAGADQLTSELSDPLLMKRYAQARAQAQIQQREMNEWNRKLLEQEARVQVLRGDSPSPTNSRQGSRAATPQTIGMRHRRNVSNMGSHGGRMTPVNLTPVAAPSYMRAGVGAALGMEPAGPLTPEASAPSMAILVSQMLQQRRAGRRATMELRPPGAIGNPSPSKPENMRSPSGSQMGGEAAGGGFGGGGGLTPMATSPALSRAATRDHLAIRTGPHHSPSPSSHMVTHNAHPFSSSSPQVGPVSPIPVYPVSAAVFLPSSSGEASPSPQLQRLGSPSGTGGDGGAGGVSGGVFLPSSEGDATQHLPSEFTLTTPDPNAPSFFLPSSSPDGSPHS